MSEQSGISENLIGKPSGGGAVKGIGETFSPDLFSGTGNFSVPIAVPKGRSEFQPQLTLGYSTGNGNGVYGLGWNLSIPGVMRKSSKGIPVYQEDVDVFILSGAEDLILVSSDEVNTNGVTTTTKRYRPRTEGLFARIEHIRKSTGEDYWKVSSKDGLISYYGNPDVTGDANTVIADPEQRDHIYQWMLYKTVNPHGNDIVYSYERDLVNSGEFCYDQLYLSQIQYMNYQHNNERKYLCSVGWEYETREDASSSFRSGFEIRTTKRCKAIHTYTHPLDADLPAGYTPNPNGENTILVKSYLLQYLDEQIASGVVLPEMAAPNGVSMLTSVTVEGDDAGIKEQLPPLEFGYSRWKPEERDLYPVEGELPGTSLADPNTTLADLNGNGLPDIIQTRGGAIRYWENQSNGSFAPPRTMKEAPLGFSLADTNVQLMDTNGDGRVEMFVNTPNQTGYFSLNHNGVWDERAFQPYKTAPTFSFADPQVKLLDLTGNGSTDVLRNGERLECFFQDEEGFQSTRFVSKQQDNNLNGVNFADPRMRLADLSGDGLQDLVMIDNGHIAYWPNKGYGNWGKKRVMKNAPRFDVPFDPSRLLIGDIDGDGQADLVYIQNNQVTLCINQSGNAWGEPLVIKGTPAVFNNQTAQLVDLNGTGVSGILWSYDAGFRNVESMFYLDFTRGVKPYVINTMNNNMGAVTKVEYISSVFYYLRDHDVIKDTTQNKAWAALTKNGTRGILPPYADKVKWQTTLPSPTQVVARTEVIDQISGGKLATVYNYHHGYWDGYEREFRGFGRVDQYDTETFERFNEDVDFNQNSTSNNQNLVANPVVRNHFSPPMYSKNWFNVGPVQAILANETNFRDAVSDFIHLNYADEFWQEDSPYFSQSAAQAAYLAALPRLARRDALRTLRGTAIRQEVYALDGTPLQNRPYTVTESYSEVRTEFTPPSGVPVDLGAYGIITNKQGSGYIFFPFGVGQRTTQWERGQDPLWQIGFTENYDAYGQPTQNISIAVPRGMDPRNGTTNALYTQGDAYLVRFGQSDFILKDEPSQYMVDRVWKQTQYSVPNAIGGNALLWRERILNQTAVSKVEGSSLFYYDGNAYDGLPLNAIGIYGDLMRSEVLVMTDELAVSTYAQLPPCFATGTPNWSTYPSQFVTELQGNDRAGYVRRTGNAVEAGFYAIGTQHQYDYQTASNLAYGNVESVNNPYGQVSTFQYDAYGLLGTQVTQSAGVITQMLSDYRLLVTKHIEDPNDNIQQFAFSPLGLLTKTVLNGKTGQNVGDTFADPSVLMEYDFFAFKDHGDPVYIKTTQREHHIKANINNKTLVSVEYSDGFGRLLQTRMQAEDVLYGNAEFGDSGLPTNQNSANQDAVGAIRPTGDPLNVVVSGWKTYNNKGKEVEVYEPFFAQGFAYQSPLEVAAYMQHAQKAEMYYDPRGQVIRTKNPDNSQQLVLPGIPVNLYQPPLLNYPPAGTVTNTPGVNLTALGYTPTPWESFTYDPNDLAGITHPNSSGSYSNSRYTPKSARIDALGRTIETVERMDANNTSPIPNAQDIVMRYAYDIRGNLLQVTDPKGRTAFTYVYDYHNKPISTLHIDSGLSTIAYNGLDMPLISTDAKGAEVLQSYDRPGRPLSTYAKEASTAFTLRQHIVYGEVAGLPDPRAINVTNKPYQHYDEAGLTTFNAYDFKGNLLHKTREVISDATLKTVFNGPPPNWAITPYTVDWTGYNTAILDANGFKTNMVYDALNRVTELELPQDVNAARKKITPTYNNAGALEAINYDGTNYVSEIAYNAKGQRILVAYGNEIMTRYAYDPLTFRLLRYRSERFAKTTSATQVTYTPQAGNVRQDLAFTFDLVGNILSTDERVTDCGIGGTPNELLRQFTYDPIYRLLSATGRESDTQNQNDYLYNSAPVPASPNANHVRAYTRNYQYDKLGNVEQVGHVATGNNFSRVFNYNTGVNALAAIETGGGSTIQNFTYDATGNQLMAGNARNYIWNAFNQLKAYNNQVGTAEPTVYAQYLYDGGGNRVKKLVRNQGGNYETLVYIDGVFEYHRLENSSTLEKNETHIMDNRSRIAVIRTGDSFPYDLPVQYYVLENQLGSGMLRLQASTGGMVIDREEYYPFGDSSLRTFTQKRFRYVVKEKDTESGLYYYGARYYAAWTCRFNSVDPLKDQYPFQNSYAYAVNNPSTLIDVNGEGPGGPEDEPPYKGADPELFENSKNDIENNDGAKLDGKPENLSSDAEVINSKKQTSSNFKISGPNKDEFVELLSKRTGLDLTLESGSLSVASDTVVQSSFTSNVLANTVIDIIDGKTEQVMINAQDAIDEVSFDQFPFNGNSKSAVYKTANDNAVDMSDFRNISSAPELQAAFLGTLLTERSMASQGFNIAHQKALQTEGDIIREAYPTAYNRDTSQESRFRDTPISRDPKDMRTIGGYFEYGAVTYAVLYIYTPSSGTDIKRVNRISGVHKWD